MAMVIGLSGGVCGHCQKLQEEKDFSWACVRIPHKTLDKARQLGQYLCRLGCKWYLDPAHTFMKI